MPTREALNLAEEQGLDLVLVAEKAQPPVTRITNHGRWKYQQSKLKKENAKKAQELKGITMRPNIAEHDLQVIIRKATKFLQEGDKVRFVCRFRPRELAHPENGQRKLDAIMEAIGEFGKQDKKPMLNGREMVMLVNPISSGGQKKNAKAEDQQNGGEEV